MASRACTVAFGMLSSNFCGAASVGGAMGGTYRTPQAGRLATGLHLSLAASKTEEMC